MTVSPLNADKSTGGADKTVIKQGNHVRDQGFTLIELAVVLLIIAILAAIAIPVFIQQREKAWVAQSQAALANGKIAAESYGTQHGGNFSGMGLGDLVNEEGFRAADTLIVLVDPEGSNYCIFVTNTLLPGGHDWQVATVHADGEPSPANACP